MDFQCTKQVTDTDFYLHANLGWRKKSGNPVAIFRNLNSNYPLAEVQDAIGG